MADELFNMIKDAYIRGATWYRKNGDFGSMLHKAAYDYADKTTGAMPIETELPAVDEWRIVPSDPTPEMLGAWYRYKNGHHWPDEPPPRDTSDYGAYRAMLAAAPSSALRHAEPVAVKALEWKVVEAYMEELAKDEAEFFTTRNNMENLWMTGIGVALDQSELVWDAAKQEWASADTAMYSAPVIAWESTTTGYIKYVTDERYQKFSDEVKRWYKPYRCTRCEKAEAELADMKADYLRRHNDAVDNMERALVAESRCEELVKALEPFANSDMRFAYETGHCESLDSCVGGVCDFTVGDLLDAAAALSAYRKGSEADGK